MAYVKIGKDKCPCYQTNRGAIVAELPYGQRSRYISSFSAKERADNSHAFVKGSKTVRAHWAQAVPMRGAKRTGTRSARRRHRQVYADGSLREATAEEEEQMKKVDEFSKQLESMNTTQRESKDKEYWREVEAALASDPRKNPKSPSAERTKWLVARHHLSKQYSLLPRLETKVASSAADLVRRVANCERKVAIYEEEMKEMKAKYEAEAALREQVIELFLLKGRGRDCNSKCTTKVEHRIAPPNDVLEISVPYSFKE